MQNDEFHPITRWESGIKDFVLVYMYLSKVLDLSKNTILWSYYRIIHKIDTSFQTLKAGQRNHCLFEVKFSAWLRRRKKEVTQMYVSFLLEKFGFMSSKKSKIRTLSIMMMSMRRIHDFVLVWWFLVGRISFKKLIHLFLSQPKTCIDFNCK